MVSLEFDESHDFSCFVISDDDFPEFCLGVEHHVELILTGLSDCFHVNLELDISFISLAIELNFQVGSLCLAVILDLEGGIFSRKGGSFLVESCDRDGLDEVVRGAVGIDTLEDNFAFGGLSNSKLAGHLPLGNLVAKLLHDNAHDFVTFTVDDHVGMLVNRSLLKVDYD